MPFFEELSEHDSRGCGEKPVDPRHDPEIVAAVGKVSFSWGRPRYEALRCFYQLTEEHGLDAREARQLHAVVHSSREEPRREYDSSG